MKDIISKDKLRRTVVIKDGKEVVRSDKLAEIFGKTHKQVLALIRKKIEFFLENNVSQKSYFIEDKHTKQGGEYVRYYLTRKGFDLIALSLRGEKANLYKLWYIDRFHELNQIVIEHKLQAKLNKSDDLWLQFREESKKFRRKLTDAINDTVVRYREDVEKKMNDGKYFYHYTQLIYRKLGINLPKGANPRDVLDKRMLVRLEDLEDKVADRIMELSKEHHYKDVYRIIKKEIEGEG